MFRGGGELEEERVEDVVLAVHPVFDEALVAEGQGRAAVGHDDGDVGVSRLSPRRHQLLGHARAVERVFQHGCGDVDREGIPMRRYGRVDEGDGFAPVEFRQHRIDPVVAEIDAAVVAEKADAVHAERVEGIVDLGQRRVDVGQREHGHGAEARDMVPHQPRHVFVEAPGEARRVLALGEGDAGRRDRQHLRLDPVPVHGLEHGLGAPLGIGPSVHVMDPGSLHCRSVEIRKDVGVYVDVELSAAHTVRRPGHDGLRRFHGLPCRH